MNNLLPSGWIEFDKKGNIIDGLGLRQRIKDNENKTEIYQDDLKSLQKVKMQCPLCGSVTEVSAGDANSGIILGCSICRGWE